MYTYMPQPKFATFRTISMRSWESAVIRAKASCPAYTHPPQGQRWEGARKTKELPELLRWINGDSDVIYPADLPFLLINHTCVHTMYGATLRISRLIHQRRYSLFVTHFPIVQDPWILKSISSQDHQVETEEEMCRESQTSINKKARPHSTREPSDMHSGTGFVSSYWKAAQWHLSVCQGSWKCIPWPPSISRLCFLSPFPFSLFEKIIVFFFFVFFSSCSFADGGTLGTVGKVDDNL